MAMRPKFTTLGTTHFNTQTQINYFPRQKINNAAAAAHCLRSERIAFLALQWYIFKSGEVGVCDVIFLALSATSAAAWCITIIINAREIWSCVYSNGEYNTNGISAGCLARDDKRRGFEPWMLRLRLRERCRLWPLESSKKEMLFSGQVSLLKWFRW